MLEQRHFADEIRLFNIKIHVDNNENCSTNAIIASVFNVSITLN